MDQQEPMYEAERIVAVMRVQGRSVTWLSEMLGYDPSTVSRVLNGRQPLSTKFAEASARVLGVPLAWLEAAGVAA